MDHNSYPQDYIKSILTQTKTIALLGASPKSDRPSYGVMRFLLSQGYDVYPVNPGQVGLIKVAYDPVKMDELGYKSDNLTMFTFEPQDSVKQFNIFATVLEYFPPIPVDRLGSLPKVNVDKKIHDFGNTSPSEVLQTVFFIANEGKEPLVIKKIQSNCNCVSAKLDRNIVLPGQNARMVVDFEIPELALGTQQKDISIFTNDPANHVQVVTVKAYVRD